MRRRGTNCGASRRPPARLVCPPPSRSTASSTSPSPQAGTSMHAASRTASTRSTKPRRSYPRPGPSSCSSSSDQGSALGQSALDDAAGAKASARGWQSAEDTMTETTSRRAVLLAAAGLGAVGLAAACSEEKRAASKATEIALPPGADAVSEFKLSIPAGALDGLQTRLAMPRWPNKETVGDWSQGVPLEKMKALADYWRTTYDMRPLEQRLNAFPQFRTQIDGLGIHFLHVKSKHSNALPIIMTHGWPGSVVEFLKVLGPLTDPTAHGGKAEDAFHMIAPSLPGYGFSDKPTARGWGIPHISKSWAELMNRTTYARYVAQGVDCAAC